MSNNELFQGPDPIQTVEDVPKEVGKDSTPNALAQVIEAEHVEPKTGLAIREAFAPFFADADEWRVKALAIKVTDVSQKADMAMARVIRLKLKDIRVSADKKRKELKEDSLRYGRAVQGAYNILEYLITPIEKNLEESEKFAEVQEAKRQADLKASREIQLAPWAEFVPFGLNLGTLSEDDFQKVLSGAKLQHQAKIDSEAKAEAERQERIKAEEAEKARVAEENRKLREENEAKERALAEQRAEQEKQLAAERAEREKLEAEKRAREQAEAAEKELQRVAAEKAAKAPDVDKVVEWTRSSWESVSHVPTLQDQGLSAKVDKAAQSIAAILDQLRLEVTK